MRMQPAVQKTDDDMASNFQSPDPKKPLNVRLRTSVHLMLADIRDCWREKAKAEGKSKEAIEAIDITYVLDRIMPTACQAELAQFGGYSETEAAKANQLKAIRESTPKLR